MKVNFCYATTSQKYENLKNFSRRRSADDLSSMMIKINRAKSLHAYLRTWCIHRVVVDLLYSRYSYLNINRARVNCDARIILP